MVLASATSHNDEKLQNMHNIRMQILAFYSCILTPVASKMVCAVTCITLFVLPSPPSPEIYAQQKLSSVILITLSVAHPMPS